MTVRLAIIGGGLSGLTAAYVARRTLGSDAVIDVYERDERPGGILRSASVAGRQVDVGAEAFVVRRPEAVALIAELGLADQVVSPSGHRPAVWAGERLHALPSPSLMGIPANAAAVGDLVDDSDRVRIDAERHRRLGWAPGTDMSVGELIDDRFGPAVTARSVDPMLGGVYSSLSADIGVREAIPALAARLDAGASSVTEAVTGLLPSASTAPVFGAVRGGYRVVVDRLAEASGAHWHCGSAPALSGVPGDWQVGGNAYDGVVVALPAPDAARLLADTVPDAAAELGKVAMAGSALVALALAPGIELPENSGVLVATGESLRAKAFTFSSRKWPHYEGSGAVWVRASFGRYTQPVTADDEMLIDWATKDLAHVCEVAGFPIDSAPIDAVVQRWPSGLPVYAPGHQASMMRVLAARPAGMGFAGAAYQGVGVPACIAQARAAVAAVVADRST
ncbi:protoporphyrinogen oxidase [Gordonia effusa NBRC 100432]|uniref:Protoporphyrinogen oxidase n=1 Tax=Gordonia effusa NBRC 100432 TaxID=1077974 RepID=H0QZQ2_9ACTN|nr:FAD-dependent oxidoreductase [Gordonia effusa]GAB18303.1 protoporphyrinogen oxidase [Gordonia effusa NBRC 100432]